MLNFYEVESHTAWIETGFGDILIVHKSEKDFNDPEERIYVTYFDSSALDYGIKVIRTYKMTYESWLMIGVSDWEEEEIPYDEANRYIIKGLFEE